MAELGYTWYPQNWRSSDSVFELTLAEKGLYREIIDQAYMEENNVVYNPSLWARRHGTSVSEIRKIVSRLAESFNPSYAGKYLRKGYCRWHQFLRKEFQSFLCWKVPEKEIHHMIGREGKRLNDTRFWLAVSAEGHRKIEMEPEWAKEMCHSLIRNKLRW